MTVGEALTKVGASFRKRKERSKTMGMIDEAIELKADAYEEMIREYKRIKYENITKENRNNEKSL